jgi:serine/threonine protein kinase
MSPGTGSGEFRGTGRYQILGKIGAGGMGAVFCARDQRRDQIVALKTLFEVEPSSIYRLNNEFRALSNVVHPNLVAFYELVSDEGQ